MEYPDFKETFTYNSIIDAMDKYDDYDPELIKQMKEDWDCIVRRMMEDKQHDKE